jgi:hypothetical protein
MKNKPKSCRWCKEDFQPRSSTQVVCSYKCATNYNRLKDWAKEKKQLTDKLRTKKDYEKILEKLINKIAREIDAKEPCTSCGKEGKRQAGHYHSVGANPSLRFNLHNIHIQCYRCNVQLSANIPGYDLGLINNYSKEYWEYVKFELVEKYPLINLSKDELQEKITICRKIIKEGIGGVDPCRLQSRSYSTWRKEIRYHFNELIGIY